jgi:bifunctional non-homologous end joining protein LigD
MPKDALQKYSDKRSFEATPEPQGRRPKKRSRSASPRFVVQEHKASTMHWDFRLERDGVLVSWAVPKGIPDDPKENRLAIHVEDHPLDYIDFEGTIPKGNYGAGEVRIWDEGTYDTKIFDDNKIEIALHGKRVNGRHILVHTHGDKWLLRRLDPPQDPTRMKIPSRIQPMLAKLVTDPPKKGEWAYEIKWDGIRAIAYIEGGRLRLESRNGNDITHQYPELAKLGRELGARDAILDGEIVALDENGLSSFQNLQARMGLRSESTIRTRAKQTPVTYMIFDLLFLEGHSTISLPYATRRECLEALQLQGTHWQTPRVHEGSGEEVLRSAREIGLEGVVAKRLDSVYSPDRRTGAWLKIKNHMRQELVIGGFTQGEGTRSGMIGALLVGYYEHGEFVYAGSVGTGFTRAELRKLDAMLEPLILDRSPFDVRSPGDTKPVGKWQAMRNATRVAPQQVTYVQPKLVCEVEFTEWTRDGTLRHPSYRGLREDKEPTDVVREDPA